MLEVGGADKHNGGVRFVRIPRTRLNFKGEDFVHIKRSDADIYCPMPDCSLFVKAYIEGPYGARSKTFRENYSS